MAAVRRLRTIRRPESARARSGQCPILRQTLDACRRARSSWSPRQSATSKTSRCGRCGCCAKSVVVAAEDTRRTGNLLRHYEIETPLLSLHEHNEHRARRRALGRLGRAIQLRSSAMPARPGFPTRARTWSGRPGRRDPGRARFPARARWPPPSARRLLSSALRFAGFPPIRLNDQKTLAQTGLHIAGWSGRASSRRRTGSADIGGMRTFLVKRPIIGGAGADESSTRSGRHGPAGTARQRFRPAGEFTS